MRIMRYGVTLGLCLILGVACTGPSEPQSKPSAESSSDRKAIPILQEQVNALDKAKALSQSVRQAEHNRQQRVDAETR